MKKTNTLLAIALMGMALTAGAQAQQKPEVNQRQQNQRARIDAGRQNGTLSQGQAHALHQEDKSMHNEIKADRTQNGGKLTPVEKKQVNQQQNQVSKQIYNEKH